MLRATALRRTGRTRLALLLLGMAVCPGSASSNAQGGDAGPVGLTIKVPVDHADPSLGYGTLYCELGALFDRMKPTVFVIADGQQFYVRKGAIADLQQKLFGPGMNVVGIVGRGFSDDIMQATVSDPSRPDWTLAWRVLSSRQWVEDIEDVRKHLHLPHGFLMLYGTSGGAYLTSEYLTVHGAEVRRAAVLSPPVRPIDRSLGINHDHFWKDLGAQAAELQRKLHAALEAHADRRPFIIRLLQRQNFFHTPDALPRERAMLVDEFARWDEAALARRDEQYQVSAIDELLESPTGPAIRVRIYEFVQPVLAGLDLFGDTVYPNIENEYHIARPLLEAWREGRIPAPSMDLGALNRLGTEMLVVAGRWDHTADYRAAISLASRFRNGLLVLADDNHQLARMEAAGVLQPLVRAFLLHGPASPETHQALEQAGEYRWSERE